MKMNPPGSFSVEGKKKISKRGSGWGVTPLEKLGKEKKKICQGGSRIKWTSEGKKKICQRGSGFKKIVEPLAEERKAKAGKGLGVKSRVGPLMKWNWGLSEVVQPD